ncbi:MAG: NADH dehydrogenase FAD-containing subunit, partial [Halobaculum sp.]
MGTRPVTETWETVRETDGEPVVVVNAHDTDHRHRSDETLLSGATVAVLDAAATVAELVGATDVVVLVNEESAVRGRVEDAVTAVGDTLPVDLEVTVGPAEYRAGSPTAALEVLEGNDRIEPRLQPPSPASHGLFGRPTAVHSVRTVLQVRAALQRELPELSPPGDSDETATERSGGTATDSAGATPTRLFSVTGDIDDPAVVELPTSGSLASARGAVTPTDGFQMACVGG